jgi:tyrosyl-tRNA synthetase
LWETAAARDAEVDGTTTVSQMLERDDFKQAFQRRAADSLARVDVPASASDGLGRNAGADIELGGTDQKFNLLQGRALQRHKGQKPQVCITMPIITGLDGVNKMSKSLGNHVGLLEPSSSMFAKIMSVPDETMVEVASCVDGFAGQR